MNKTHFANAALSFHPVSLADVDRLMTIEEACHSHPWSNKTFASCIGGRYFGDLAQEVSPAIENEQALIGFYIGEFIIDEATLMDICVAPNQQGKGHGKTLLNQFLAQAKSKGANKIWLEVRAKNIAAQMLYMNAGFVEVSRRTGYYPSSTGFGYEDAIVMSLSC